MKTKPAILLTVFLWVFFTTSCARALVRVDGPYVGRVIDSETREPVEGVVVLAVWNTETATVAGAISRYYDAEETVTDTNGDFRFEGQGLRVVSNLEPPIVTIFKAGYDYISIIWPGLVNLGYLRTETTRDPETYFLKSKDIYDEKLRVRWEGKKPIIPLRKLTEEEMKEISYPSIDFDVPERYLKHMNAEIEKFRRMRPRPVEIPGFF
jgi:heme-degrading monooxygenase HmoA